MIELIVYPKPQDQKLINNSPFCSKSEIFLKLNKLDYKVTNFEGNPGKFPNAKLPVIKCKNEIINDSSFIQKYLEKEFKVDMDAHLSDAEKAQGFAFAKMAEEYLYWSLLHERWFIDKNWVKLRDGYFDKIPKLVRGFVTGMIRKSTKKSALGHGMARHSDKDVMALGKEAIKSISDFLGSKTFILGDKVSSYDTSIYASISSLIHSPLGPELQRETQKYQNLVDYDKRMYELVFS